MWTRLKPPCWRRCHSAGRTSPCGIARQRVVKAAATVRSSSTAIKTYYDVLGVEPTASADDIKSAFRRQAKLLHPDVSKSADSEEDFKQLKEAYDVLSDSEQRSEYDEALQRRSSRGAGSSNGRSRRVVIVEDDPWGFGGTTVEVVVEGFDDDDDDDDDGDGFLDEIEYMAWAATPGNMRSSFQSSWQANSRKARRGQQRQQAAAMKAKLSLDDKALLLQEMVPQVRAAAQQVFGSRLQSLNTLQELAEVMEAVMEMNFMGIEFEVMGDLDSRGAGARGSRRQGGGGSARARRPGGGGGSSGRRRRM